MYVNNKYIFSYIPRIFHVKFHTKFHLLPVLLNHVQKWWDIHPCSRLTNLIPSTFNSHWPQHDFPIKSTFPSHYLQMLHEEKLRYVVQHSGRVYSWLLLSPSTRITEKKSRNKTISKATRNLFIQFYFGRNNISTLCAIFNAIETLVALLLSYFFIFLAKQRSAAIIFGT